MSTEAVDVNQKYFKLASCVDLFLSVDVDLSVSHYFQKYLTVAKAYLVELRTEHAQDVKTELLDVSDVLTVQLPVSTVSVSKVAEPWGQYIRTLAVNDQLSLTDRTLGNPEFIYSGPPDQLPNGTDITNYGGYEFSNYGGRTLFSIGGGLPSKGFYRMKTCEDGCKELYLDVGVCQPQVYVEYITTGLSPCSETFLNPFEFKAVRKALNHHWEKTRKDGGKTEAAIFRTGQELYHAEAVVRASKNSMSPEDVVQITRKYFRLTPKI
jgi:hypothetical protein